MKILLALSLLASAVFADSFGGIGVTIQSSTMGVQVVTVMPASSADAAGILPGDQITMVNDVALAGKPLEVATSMIRGEMGSELMLTVAKADGSFWSGSLLRVGLKLETVNSQDLNAWYSNSGSALSAEEIQAYASAKTESGYELLGVLQYGRLVTANSKVSPQEVTNVYMGKAISNPPSIQVNHLVGMQLLGFDRETLQIDLNAAGTSLVQVIDARGKVVKEWKLENATSGSHLLAWNGKSQATGAYSIRVMQNGSQGAWQAQLR